MQKVKIVTDSTAYLTEEQKKEYDISVVPLVVTLGNETFKEGEKYTNKEFFNQMRVNKELFPTTSQPAIGEFKETFERLSGEADSIIVILLSAGISGTVQAAKTAASLARDVDVTVIDSETTSAGLEYLVIEAAKMAREGKSKEEIVKTVEHMKETLTTLFMVDTFEYLQRGGRIGGARALLGTVLQIKPILYIRGEIDVFQKIRTRKKAINRMLAELDEFMQRTDVSKARVGVIHVDCREEAEKLKAQIVEKYPGLQCGMAEVGPVIGSHVGPGTLGIGFCSLP
ncbi:MAG: DegV family protein [Thermoanaerobacteraceae bacterium]|nr:DegV family protein [Thermoanaerobacteraceae bacterium]